MKRTTIILGLAACCLLSAGAAYLTARAQARRHFDERQKWFFFGQLLRSRVQAAEAYFNADPEIAIWALRQEVEVQVLADRHGASRLLGTHPQVLQGPHTRLALLHRHLGHEREAAKHMQAALAIANMNEGGTLATEESLLAAQARFDSIDRESYTNRTSQPAPRPYPSKAADGLPVNGQE